METIAEDKKQIERLLKKCDIKEANGMNSDKELMEALQIMATHPAPQEEVDAYVDGYTKLALSILNEAGEVLSDIPMGQARQFAKLVKQEYETFKDLLKKYETNEGELLDICKQFWRFNAVSEYLENIIMKLSDKEEFVETPELNEFNVNFIKVTKDDDTSVCIKSIKNTLEYCDAIINLLTRGFETNDIALMTVTIFYLTTTNLYNHYSIEYMENKSKKAPV